MEQFPFLRSPHAVFKGGVLIMGLIRKHPLMYLTCSASTNLDSVTVYSAVGLIPCLHVVCSKLYDSLCQCLNTCTSAVDVDANLLLFSC